MELQRLRARLGTARRGHKLLKDKTDEMTRRFMTVARRNKELREEVEAELGEAMKGFVLARALTPPSVVVQTLMMPSRTVSLNARTGILMGVRVPAIGIEQSEAADLFPYSFISVTSEMDSSVQTLNNLLLKLIKLAQTEKTTNVLADEIEKSKRRVNALEYVLIPQLEETVKYIRFRLEENERGALVRLMKVKEKTR